MTNTLKYADYWTKLIEKISIARGELNCSYSKAWFRGQLNTNWNLNPSLLRYGHSIDMDNLTEINNQKQKISSLKAEWKDALNRKKELKRMLREVELKTIHHNDKVSKIAVREKYHLTIKQINLLQNEISIFKRKLHQYCIPVNGEREIFDEYIFKSSKANFNSSWEVLGEMRHYGIQTRLLDWTDRLDIALYFALEKYRNLLDGLTIEQFLEGCKKHPTPCIWIFNPYSFSKKITGRTTIWDIVRLKDLDYYNCILVNRNWEFDEPIPIYPPSYFERINAQNGYFLVFGNNKLPLDLQLKKKNKFLRKVEITPEAAIYGIDYLRHIQGLNKYSVFRDLDSLGKELATKFQRYQKYGK